MRLLIHTTKIISEWLSWIKKTSKHSSKGLCFIVLISRIILWGRLWCSFTRIIPNRSTSTSSTIDSRHLVNKNKIKKYNSANIHSIVSEKITVHIYNCFPGCAIKKNYIHMHKYPYNEKIKSIIVEHIVIIIITTL